MLVLKISAGVMVVVFALMAANDLEMTETWGCDLGVPILCAEMPSGNRLQVILRDEKNSYEKWMGHLLGDFAFMLAYGTLFGVSPYLNGKRENGFKSLICFASYVAAFCDFIENTLLLSALQNERTGSPTKIPTSSLEPVIYGLATAKFFLLSVTLVLHGVFWGGIALTLVPLGLLGLGTPLKPMCAFPCCAGFLALSLSIAQYLFSKNTHSNWTKNQ
eukprot:TRINITY_DN2849_c4_g1_i1.p1 TRINITY_DN2849_c4_g1~~TRINITY_DN2849_c4_g1_i1.p1  ORF type:complete len:235 (+),score=37.66 TRINITY_DN2849_c4_g1_i1:52-705(+)